MRRIIPGTNYAVQSPLGRIIDVELSSIVHQVIVSLTDAETKLLPTTPFAVIPPTENLDFSTLATRYFLLISATLFSRKPTHAGYTYDNPAVDLTPTIILAWGSRLDWPAVSAIGAIWYNVPDYFTFHIQQDLGVWFVNTEDYLINFSCIPQFDGGGGTLIDNGLYLSLGTPSGVMHNLDGGDSSNTVTITASFYVYDVATNKYLTVAESGWNQSTRLFET